MAQPQKKRIGDILLDQGLINMNQLQIALQEQKKSGELLGAVLFSLGFISQKDLFKVLTIVESVKDDSKGDDEKDERLSHEMENLVRQSSSMFQRDRVIGKKELDSAYSPLVNLVEKIIIDGIQRGATDIHVNPDMKGIRIRYRVDGILHHSMFLPIELLNPIVSRFKIMGQMNIAESRIPQDGAAEFQYKNRKLDLRISVFPVMGGENIVVRLLDKAQIKVGLENLGFLDEDIERLNQSIQLPFGMILVTGPTGSGKTTTLYSCLSMINTVSRNIITLEDPVEYHLPMIRQSQINVKAGLTFANGLRSILRQDPDVIMVGELRDRETADISVQAALTGHLVFSTLHTNNASGTISRFLDMGVEPFLISSSLIGILAQRLVRVVCSKCKEQYTPIEKLEGLDKNVFYRGAGCKACNDTGYYGRIGIFELMIIDDKIKKLIVTKASSEEIEKAARENGMRTLREDGLLKIKNGITTQEEVLRVTSEQ